MKDFDVAIYSSPKTEEKLSTITKILKDDNITYTSQVGGSARVILMLIDNDFSIQDINNTMLNSVVTSFPVFFTLAVDKIAEAEFINEMVITSEDTPKQNIYNITRLYEIGNDAIKIITNKIRLYLWRDSMKSFTKNSEVGLLDYYTFHGEHLIAQHYDGERHGFSMYYKKGNFGIGTFHKDEGKGIFVQFTPKDNGNDIGLFDLDKTDGQRSITYTSRRVNGIRYITSEEDINNSKVTVIDNEKRLVVYYNPTSECGISYGSATFTYGNKLELLNKEENKMTILSADGRVLEKEFIKVDGKAVAHGEMRLTTPFGDHFKLVNNNGKKEEHWDECSISAADHEGRWRYSDGEMYYGEFCHRLPHGEGHTKFPSGTTYSGYYVDGLFNGKGIMEFTGGSKYVGDFKNGYKEGFGKYTFDDGNIYEGEFRNNVKCGRGKFYYNNGNVYEGEFRNDVIEGRGILTFKESGDVYEGEMKDWEKCGKGEYRCSNGKVYKGTFENDDIVEGEIIYTDNVVFKGTISNYFPRYGEARYNDGSIYVGAFSNNQPNGGGVRTYSDGAKYSGQFKNFKFEGKGEFQYPNGEILKGTFVNGAYRNNNLTYDENSSVKPKKTSFFGKLFK